MRVLYILGCNEGPSKRYRVFNHIEALKAAGHHAEWIRACKGGEKGGSNFDWAGPMTETILLGNVAIRPQLREKLTKVKLLWDAENLAFLNCEEANQFLRRDYRSGWEV